MPEHESEHVPRPARPGRAASTNRSGRFESYETVALDDGWPDDPDGPAPLRTEIRAEPCKSIIARNTSPDVSFDRSINPYRGCEHGCIYCFARPTHAFLGLSPGLDFESRIVVKQNAAAVLRQELSRPSYAPATIAIGTNTDPYQPAEKSLEVMKGILSVLSEFRHPVGIVTKGALIRRDTDVLAAMAGDGLAKVGISLTTLDGTLCRALEPRAASPVQRLKSIECLAKAGVPVRVMVAPVIPGLTDHEIDALLASAADAGATMASYITLRLPLEVDGLFRAWLDEHRPMRAKKIIARLCDLHGGRSYDASFGHRMRGRGVLADLIARRFELACTKNGLSTAGLPLRTDLFRVPGRGQQLALF